MNVEGLSTMMAHSRVHQQVDISLASKIKDVAEQNAANLLRMMEQTRSMQQSVTPNLGSNIDVQL